MVTRWDDLKHKAGAERLAEIRELREQIERGQPAARVEDAAIVKCAGCGRILRVVSGAFPAKAWAQVDVACACGVVAPEIPVAADPITGAALPWRVE